jgi:hypothetical protein
MHRIDGEGATSDNKFTEGNPQTGLVATEVTADWLNSIQEEVIAVLTAAGIPPSKASNTQLRDAILSLITGGGSAVAAEGVSIADAGNYITGTNVEAALQQLAAQLYGGTFSSNKIRRQVVVLDGPTFQTELAHAENVLEISYATGVNYTVRPDSELNLPIGTCIQVAQTGGGKITFIQGAGVTLLKGASFNARTMEQNGIAVLIKRAANVWRVGGALEAA